MTLIVRPETDQKQCYNSRRLSVQQSYVVVPSTWLDETDRQECVSGNSDERNGNREGADEPLPVSLQIVNDQRDTLTSEDDYLHLLYPCWQHIRSQYSCDPLSVRSIFDIANSSTAYQRGMQLQRLCIDNSEAPSASSASSLSYSAITTESSDVICSSREIASPPQDVVTTARCSETTATKSTALASTPSIDEQRTSHRDISQQAGYDENMPTEHPLCCRGNSQRIGNKPDDVMNNESHNEFSDVNITDNEDTNRTRTRDALYHKRLVEGRECASEASTSPSLLIDAKCSKNQGNKVWYRYTYRRCPHQNCRRAKTLPKQRQKEQVKHRQYDSMI